MDEKLLHYLMSGGLLVVVFFLKRELAKMDKEHDQMQTEIANLKLWQAKVQESLCPTLKRP